MRLITVFVFIALFSRLSLALDIKVPANSLYKKSGEDSFATADSATTIPLPANSSILLKTPNNLPLLIYHPANDNSKVEISDGDLKQISETALEPRLNQALNELTSANLEIQKLIQRKNYSEALSQLNRLKSKYPQVALVHFLEGTLHYLQNDKTLAIQALERGLLIQPDNTEAQTLLKQLKGGTR